LFRISIIILLMWGFSVQPALAQHLGYRKYTVDDGLVQSEVVSLFQDSRGFLWVGTKFGVSKFDGNNFVTRFDSMGVLKSSVYFIGEISGKRVIAAASSGYVIFEAEGSIKSFKYPVFHPDAILCNWISGGRAFFATLLSNKVEIYESTLKGTVNVSAEFEKLISVLNKFDVTEILRSEKFNCFYFKDKTTGAYCFANNVVSKLYIPSFQFFHSGLDGNVYVTSSLDLRKNKNLSNTVNSTFDPNQLYSLEHVVYRLDGKKCTRIFDFQTKELCTIPFFIVSKTGKIAIPIISLREMLFYENGKKNLAVLQLDEISAILFDDEGTIWIGTAIGLQHIFPEYFLNFTDDEGLFPNIQSLVADANGMLWAASYNRGIQYYSNGSFVKKEMNFQEDKKEPLYFFPGSRMDHLGKVHFCVNPLFSMVWDGRKIYRDKNGPAEASLYFYDDTITHKYYFGGDKGLIEQDYTRQTFKAYPMFPGLNKRSKIVSIVRALDGKLLLGGFSGMIIHDGKSFEKVPNRQHPDMPGANAMERDHKGNIWIGNGSGIYFYNNKNFSKISNDYFNDLVLSLKCIDSSRLLIGGIRGMGILDLNLYYKNGSVRIRYFDKNNGFIGGECQQNCITRDQDGYFWIGASNGIVRFDASAISNEIRPPRVYLTNVFTNNERMEWKPLTINDFNAGKKQLTFSENNVRFEFTAICFSSPENVRFSYKLEGFDNQWSKPGSDRRASYTNLPEGSYLFKVRVCNDSGVWSEEAAEFRIMATAPIWQRWYFILFIMILFSVLLVISIARFLSRRTRLIRERLYDERRFAELQFRTLRNQLAPHFVFNALNAIGSSIYQNDKEKSYDYLQRFATLIRATLVHSDKSYRTLNEEVEFVKNYLDLEQFRFENRFDYQIRIEDTIDKEIPVPKMIIQTFAENAVKHGLVQRSVKGILNIDITTNEEYLNILVEDNGIGRVESMRYNTGSTGKGMEIITEFIELFNRFNEKKLKFEVNDKLDASGKISGTRVIIQLPVDFTYISITK